MTGVRPWLRLAQEQLDPHERDVLALATSLLDWAPAPKTWTGSLVRASAEPGEIAAKPVRCPACEGSGRRRVRGVMQACDRCHGCGRLLVDPQTLKEPITSAEAPRPLTGTEREQWRHHVDSQLRGFEMGERVISDDEAEEDMLLRAVRKRDEQYLAGDYELLERALAALRVVRPGLHAWFWRYVVLGESAEQSSRAPSLCVVVVRLLASTMPAKLRVPGWAFEATARPAGKGRHANRFQQQRFHQEVVECYFANGQSSLRVARLLGLSDRRVRQIVASAVTAAQGSAA